MKRRLNLAVALLHEPELVLLDEPTVGVDPQSRHHIFESIESRATGGRSVVYTRHRGWVLRGAASERRRTAPLPSSARAQACGRGPQEPAPAGAVGRRLAAGAQGPAPL